MELRHSAGNLCYRTQPSSPSSLFRRFQCYSFPSEQPQWVRNLRFILTSWFSSFGEGRLNLPALCQIASLLPFLFKLSLLAIECFMVKFFITKFLGEKATVESGCSGKFSESLQPWHKFPQHCGLSILLGKVTDLMPEPWGCWQLYTMGNSIIEYLILHVKKKNQDPKSSGNELNSQAVFVLVVRSHIPGVSMHHRFNDHTASSERSYFWFFGWYQIYEKCFCFPQIRVQEIKTSSRQV